MTVRTSAVTPAAATLAMLRHFKAFITSAFREMHDPRQWGFYLTREEAARELAKMIDIAVNRRGGIPDQLGRKQDSDYQMRLHRDRRRIEDKVQRRVRLYDIETPELRKRFAHLIDEREFEVCVPKPVPLATHERGRRAAATTNSLLLGAVPSGATTRSMGR